MSNPPDIPDWGGAIGATSTTKLGTITGNGTDTGTVTYNLPGNSYALGILSRSLDLTSVSNVSIKDHTTGGAYFNAIPTYKAVLLVPIFYGETTAVDVRLQFASQAYTFDVVAVTVPVPPIGMGSEAMAQAGTWTVQQGTPPWRVNSNDGDLATVGLKNDAAQTDPTQSATLMAFLKGLHTQLNNIIAARGGGIPASGVLIAGNDYGVPNKLQAVKVDSTGKITNLGLLDNLTTLGTITNPVQVSKNGSANSLSNPLYEQLTDGAGNAVGIESWQSIIRLPVSNIERYCDDFGQNYPGASATPAVTIAAVSGVKHVVNRGHFSVVTTAQVAFAAQAVIQDNAATTIWSGALGVTNQQQGGPLIADGKVINSANNQSMKITTSGNAASVFQSVSLGTNRL